MRGLPMLSVRIAAAALMMALIPAAYAAQPFDAKTFRQAQEAGKPILVDVTAGWCPVCAKQKQIIESLEAQQPELTVFEVDFDSAADTLKTFGVRYQSTLIVFKGKTEIGRSIGVTDPGAIRSLVAKGL